MHVFLVNLFNDLVQDLSENHFVRKLPKNKYYLKKTKKKPQPDL